MANSNDKLKPSHNSNGFLVTLLKTETLTGNKSRDGGEGCKANRGPSGDSRGVPSRAAPRRLGLPARRPSETLATLTVSRPQSREARGRGRGRNGKQQLPAPRPPTPSPAPQEKKPARLRPSPVCGSSAPAGHLLVGGREAARRTASRPRTTRRARP